MNTFLPLIFVFTLLTFTGINAQWYIIKKDYPSMSMNYPNPGKRTLSDVDCSIPYSSLSTFEEKTTWLLSCNNVQSPLITVDDSSSDANSMEEEFYPSPRLILHERRTPRAIPPPYFNDQRDVFNIRLLKRLRRSIKSN